METHFTTCNLCEAMCGIAVDVEDGRLAAIRGDRDDPFSQGHICPKAVALRDVHEDPDRLRRPLRRRGSIWEEISWDEALAEAGARLAAVQAAHGRDAVAVYQGNPTVHNYGSLLFARVFLRALRSRSLYSATSVDQLPSMLAALLMFGHQLLIPIPDVDRTRLFLILGANPLASNGSLMTAGGIERRLKALRSRGGRLVVVDPRRTETAALADAHLPIRPGTDALLLFAILHTLAAEDRMKPGRLAAMASGLETAVGLAKPFAPEAVAEATGIPAETIRTLARDLAAAESAVVYGRVGVSTQEFGGLCAWLINVLNVATGNLDRPGGAMFTRPAADLVSVATRIGSRGHFAKRRSRVRGLPEFAGEWPVATLADEIETEGQGQVRALVTSAGNPVLSTPNGGRLDAALSRLEYMVSIDIYLNETTRHAHLVLPPTSFLEHDHYDLAFHLLAVRDTAKYAPAVIPPPSGARHDWQIFLGLAAALDRARGRTPLTRRLARAALGRVGPKGVLAYLLRTGPHGAGWLPWNRGLTLGRLQGQPHGLDLGPLAPCLPERLFTPDRRIDLAPAAFVADVPRLEAARRLRAAVSGSSLELIGRRELRSNNSWMHNSPCLAKGPDLCTLMMHPSDAAARRLGHGERVRIRSRVGAVEATLEVTEAVRPGVVSMPHGWGHDRDGVRLQVAEARPGASVNDLTDEARVDALTGNAAFSGVPVEVMAAS
jgi:anaerobic selenocysteine-containing dehydrogenase